MSLERAFYEELIRIAAEDAVTLPALVARIDSERDRHTNLSSALRLFVLDALKQRPDPSAR